MVRRALAGFTEVLGPDHPRTRGVADSLATTVRLRQGRMTPEEIVAAAPAPKKRQKKIKPNDRCPCNSGKKYKKCCRDKDRAAAAGKV